MTDSAAVLPPGVWGTDLDTLRAALDSQPLTRAELAQEVTVLEATVGYVREQPEAVERRVAERWLEQFAGIPAPIARRAFRDWERGDRMPSPRELALRAHEIAAEAAHRVKLHTEARKPQEPVSEPVREPMSVADRLAAVEAELEKAPHSAVLNRLYRQIKAEVEADNG